MQGYRKFLLLPVLIEPHRTFINNRTPTLSSHALPSYSNIVRLSSSLGVGSAVPEEAHVGQNFVDSETARTLPVVEILNFPQFLRNLVTHMLHKLLVESLLALRSSQIASAEEFDGFGRSMSFRI